MIAFQRLLVLITGCSSLVLSEAVTTTKKGKKGKKASVVPTDFPTITAVPTTLCDSRPIEFFFYELEDVFVRSAKFFQVAIDNQPAYAQTFQPVLDASEELRAGAVAIMEGVSGCMSPYPLPEVTESTTAPSKRGKKTKKNKAGKKSSKGFKKTGKTEEPKETVTAAPTPFDVAGTASPTPFDVFGTVQNAALLFLENTYIFNSFNVDSGVAWTYMGYGPFEEIPVGDITIGFNGEFNAIVCGYYRLHYALTLQHKELTGTDDIVKEIDDYKLKADAGYGEILQDLTACF
eukprot:CAMPEP_0194267952 /NCGR_PEP_ID=MMETSP0169-20130528/2357_1 /TAXON_ID=218684 /ORGANISM="Corethron pennatum, Strain L29A3" /LENGTH=289 /DNA_ID=CAMNT_0039008985 /DNA_START=129 /DNA_END=998 /DNA_ORIENTATION=+